MNDQIRYYRSKLKYATDSADLAGLFQKGTGENVIVIDTRSAEAYEEEHIPGAVSFPHRTMNAQTLKNLNRDKLYVIYCDGIGCNASTKGALKMAELGFDVKELMGGLDWWKRDGYSTDGTAGVKGKMEVHCAC